MKRFIDVDFLLENSKKVNDAISSYGWYMDYDGMMGTIGFYNENIPDVGVYATPNWETDGKVPFSVNKHDIGDYTTPVTINLDGDFDSQFNHYISILVLIFEGLKNYNK